MSPEALFVSSFVFGSKVFFPSFFFLDDKQVLFECKLPFHSGHQIRRLAYRFQRLFSLDVASPFYS
jgi:hypothetical protein